MAALNGVSVSRVRVPIGAGFIVKANDSVGIITGGGTSSGYAQAGAAVTTLRALGVATGAFYDSQGNKLKLSSPTSLPGDNTSGADGAIWAEIETSFGKNGIVVFVRKNGTSTDACTQADVGSTVYFLDAVTVSRLVSGKSSTGKLWSLNGDGTVNIVFPVGGS